jgi:hypothetical protein
MLTDENHVFVQEYKKKKTVCEGTKLNLSEMDICSRE